MQIPDGIRPLLKNIAFRIPLLPLPPTPRLVVFSGPDESGATAAHVYALVESSGVYSYVYSYETREIQLTGLYFLPFLAPSSSSACMCVCVCGVSFFIFLLAPFLNDLVVYARRY